MLENNTNDKIIDESKDICGICCEDIKDNDRCTLGCNHIFHKKCIKKMFDFNMKSCPMCRFHIEGNPVDKFEKCQELYTSLNNEISTISFDIQSFMNDLNELSEINFIKANILIGDVYLDGIIFEKDINKAVDYYKKAASQNDNLALYKLGILFYKLDKKEKSYEYLDLAAKNGYVEAQFVYGCYLVQDIYSNVRDVREIGKKTFGYLYKSSESNVVESYVEVANCYYLGIGTDKNNELAFKYYKKAADFGIIDGLYFTGLFLYYGYGVKPDYSQAKLYLNRVLELNVDYRDTSIVLKEINDIERFSILNSQFESINISE